LSCYLRFSHQGTPVIIKLGRGEAGDIFKKDGTRPDVFNEIQGSGEHVAGVIGTKLLACDAERRARNARSQEVNAGKILIPEVSDVLLHYIPVRPVFSQGGAKLWLVFNCGGVMEPGHLKAESLTTTTSAKFQDSKTHLYRFELI
jgi:hypothetical protein